MQTNASPSKTDKERDALLKQFRAHLHLAITAKQTGQDKQLEAMPGPRMQDYCMELAELPDNTLAIELAAPVTAIFNQINNLSQMCENTLRRNDEQTATMHAPAKRVLAELDFALALILRHFRFIKRRAELTECEDLLVDVLCGMALGRVDAAHLVRRWQEKFPDSFCNDDGSVADDSFPDLFAWDVYQRVEALDKLADDFPNHVRTAARRMHAWPMLIHRHTNNRRRFQKLAKLLELGVDYPLDASEGARFRTDTPLVRYLDPHIHRLHILRSETGDRQFGSVKEEQDWLCPDWWKWPDEPPGEDVLAPLRAARQLPPLTKATAAQWAEKAIVPLILATDARDWQNCDEPVLQKISRQKGVKSRATFKSRLLAAVTATLRRLARPA